MILTVLVPLSFLVVWKLADFVTGTILMEKDTVSIQNNEFTVRQKDDICVIFSIRNKSLLCALRGTWIFTAGNAFYGTSDPPTALLPVPPRGDKQFRMTVTVTELGRVVFACREFILTDLLGIFMVHTACDMECSLYVLPRQDDIASSELPDAYSGTAELSESQQKGSDYSEVTDIRTYQPGDRPRDIHWRLSPGMEMEGASSDCPSPGKARGGKASGGRLPQNPRPDYRTDLSKAAGLGQPLLFLRQPLLRQRGRA